MFKCEICGKVCVSSRGLKRHQGMKHKNAKALPGKVSKLRASEFSSLVKRCSSIYQQDLCLSQNIRSKFGSFDFTDDDALELWKYLEPVVEEFHGMLRNITRISMVYSTKTCYHKSVKEILLSPVDILLSEIANHLLIHYTNSGGGTDDSKYDCSNSDYSAIPEREIKTYNALLDMLFISSTALRTGSFLEKASKKSVCAVMIKIITFANYILL